MLNDKLYFDKLKDHVLLESTSGDFYNLAQLKEKLGDKKEAIYTTNRVVQASYIESYEQADTPVIIMDQMIDTHFIARLESESDLDLKFHGVDSAQLTGLIDEDASKDVIVDSKDQKNKNEKLTEVFKKHINGDLEIKIEALKNSELPAMLVEDETMRRYREMAKMNSGMDISKLSEMLSAKQTLIVNKNCPAITKILDFMNGLTPSKDKEELLVKYVFDLAKLQQGTLDEKSMVGFVSRSSKVLALLN